MCKDGKREENELWVTEDKMQGGNDREKERRDSRRKRESRNSNIETY